MEPEGPIRLKICLASCVPCGSPKTLDPGNVNMQQNPTWRRRVTGDPTGLDKYASLPVNVEEWGPEVVMQWMELCGMGKMKSKLKGMGGKELLMLQREDVSALTVKNPMDCFVFSAHLGELRRRHGSMLDGDTILDTPFVTPRFGTTTASAFSSVNSTPRFPQTLLSSPSNPLGLPEEYLHAKEERAGLGDSMDVEASLKCGPQRDGRHTQSVEVKVKPTGETLEDMVREVLSEQAKQRNSQARSTIKAAVRSIEGDVGMRESVDSLPDERIDAAIESLMESGAAEKEELREALIAALWQPLIGSPDGKGFAEEMKAAEAAAAAQVASARELADKVVADMGDSVMIGTVTAENSMLTSSFRHSASTIRGSIDSVVHRSGEADDAHSVAVEDDLVPIREKFEHSPITTPTKNASDNIVSHVVADEDLLMTPARPGEGSSIHGSTSSLTLLAASSNTLNQSPRFASGFVSDSAQEVTLHNMVPKTSSDYMDTGDVDIHVECNDSRTGQGISEVMKAAQAAADSAVEVAQRAVTPLSEEGSPISTPKRAVAEDEPHGGATLSLSMETDDGEGVEEKSGGTNSTSAPHAKTEILSPRPSSRLHKSPSAQTFPIPKARDALQWRSDPTSGSFSPILTVAAMEDLVSICSLGNNPDQQPDNLSFPPDSSSGENRDGGGSKRSENGGRQGGREGGATGSGGGGTDGGADGREGRGGKRVFGVPKLPVLYVHRPEIFDMAKREVMAGNSVAILGIDSLLGIGTSTLAAAVARDEDVVAMHDAGVFWLNCRDGVDDRRQLQLLSELMVEAGCAPPQRGLPDAQYFIDALAERQALLVLDDSPRYNSARMFMEFGFQLVVMSRDQAMPHQLGVTTCIVPVVERDQAGQFLALASAAKNGGTKPGEGEAMQVWQEVSQSVGGLPMELEMIACLAAGKPKAVLRKICKKMDLNFRLPELTGLGGGSAHWQAFIRTMSVSVDLLPISKHCLYKALAILPPGVRAPTGFLCKLWNIEGSGEEQVAKALEHARSLHSHGLLELEEGEAGGASVYLHDLHSQFLRAWAAKQLVSMHNALLSAYRKGETSFSLVADDGYYMQHVATHLMAAGREPQLRMMLFDVAWLEAKFARYGLFAVLADFGMYLQSQEDEEVKLLMQAIELSGPSALAHPEVDGLLATQASCRLLSRRVQHGGLSRWIRAVRERHSRALVSSVDGALSQAAATAGPASLWTRAHSLVQAGGCLLKTLSSFSSAPTKCMSVTPDGGLLLTVEGRVSRLWDVHSGYCIRVLEGFQDSLMNGALSPDGAYAVTIADHKGEDIGRVWDCATGSCAQILEGHTDLIQDLQVSGDSRLAVTASYDHSARVWRLSDGKCTHVLRGHTDYVESAAFSKDSTRVVTGSWDRTARVWDTASGACLHTLEGHSDRVWRVVIGSSTLVTTSWDMTACVWEVESGEGVWRLEGHTDVVHASAISEDERWVVTAAQDGTARVWDVTVGRCCHVLTGQGSAGKLAVSPDGSKAVAMSDSSDSVAQVWDLRSGKCVRRLEGHGAKVTGLAVTQDGARALTVSWDRTARLWDLSSDDSDGVAHQGSVSAICLQDGCDTMLSSAADGTARLWACINAQPLYTAQPAGLAAALLGGLGLAASIAADGRLRLWDLENGECVQALQLDGDLEAVSSYANGAVTPRGGAGVDKTRELPACLLAAGSGTVVSCLASGTVEVWTVSVAKRRASIVAQLEHEEAVSLLSVSHDGCTTATVSRSSVFLWDALSGDLNGELPPFDDGDGVAGVGLSADGAVVVAVGRGNSATVWDAGRAPPRFRFRLKLGERGSEVLKAQPVHAEAQVEVSVSLDGLRAATSSRCGVVELWDLSTGTQLRQFHRTLPVSGLALSSAATHVVACGNDGSVVLWDCAAPADQSAGAFFGDAPIKCCAIRTHCTLSDDEVIGEEDLCITAGDANGQVHTLSF